MLKFDKRIGQCGRNSIWYLSSFLAAFAIRLSNFSRIPDLTGKKLGLTLVNAGLDFARKQFAPDYFRLFVLTFNQRAIKVYERAGFEHVGIYVQKNSNGEREFQEMRRTA
ncbi:MAG TPA: GNAT family protein [Ktedonobacteraceae bacterium]|jgi:RimJ/RimL family protein N-acetyltransferase|nr:GNAT family protein [Ktedonobacteraceae bacterium]